MSLFDVDKNSEDRGSPMPNTHDTIISGAHKAHGTLSGNYTSDATPANPNTGVFGATATFVQTGVAHVLYSGPAPITNTTTVPHNLGYAPTAICFLNDASVNGAGSSNIPLPTWLSLTLDLTESEVSFSRWMDFSTDATNLYIYTHDAAGTGGGSISLFVTFYLYRLPAGTS